MAEGRGGVKRRVDTLLLCHAAFAALAGALAFLAPHVFEFFFVPHGERLVLRDNADAGQKLEHLTVRLYGALILGQAWITWCARRTEDAYFRRALVQAYCGVFALTTLGLLRAQLTPGGNLNGWSWLNTALFAGLAGGYGWFAFVQKLAVFEGLGKAGA